MNTIDIQLLRWTGRAYAVGNDLHEMRRRARDRAQVDVVANINRDLKLWREAARQRNGRRADGGGDWSEVG